MTGWLSVAVLPMLLLASAGLLLFRGRATGEALLLGARSGAETALSLLPTLVLLLAGVSMLEASGLTEALVRLLRRPAAAVGIPAEILPLLILRPLTGAGSSAALTELLGRYGADSPIGILASVIAASSDTLFYLFAVYFSAARVTRTRYALPAAMITVLFSVLAAAFLCGRLL